MTEVKVAFKGEWVRVEMGMGVLIKRSARGRGKNKFLLPGESGISAIYGAGVPNVISSRSYTLLSTNIFYLSLYSLTSVHKGAHEKLYNANPPSFQGRMNSC